jgi:tyrosinase
MLLFIFIKKYKYFFLSCPFMGKELDMITVNTNTNSPVKLNRYERRFNYAYNVPSERITFAETFVHRKNEADMSDPEKNAFRNAITTYNMLPASSELGRSYRQTVAIHQMDHRMHSGDDDGEAGVGAQRFLTWHRIYLAFLEGDIRIRVDGNFFIPYWDWIKNPRIPQWLEDFLPTVRIPNAETTPPANNYNNVTVFRTPGQRNPIPTKQQVDDLSNIHTYTAFTNRLEGLHNNVHTYVGGTFVNLATAPADPLFWLHHANVDRIWSLWQAANPNQNPTLSPANQYMDPWNLVESQWRTNNYIDYV